MKLSKIGLLAGAAVALATATTADATVNIAYSYNGGAVTNTGVVGATSATFTGAVGSFVVNAASGSTGLVPYLLNSTLQADKVGGAAASLDIYITATDLTSFAGLLTSTFTENVLPANWSVTESTYYDTTNGLFGGTLLSTSPTFTGLAVASVGAGPLSLTGPFSITHKYHIVAGTAKGSSLSTISLAGSSAVPEPATWALMLGGFGLAGLALRSRASKYRVGYTA